MPQTQEEKFESLLASVQKGISSFGIRDFHDYIDEILMKKGDRDKFIKVIIAAVCCEFNISETQLLRGYAKGEIKEPKYICICLIHNELKLATRKIARYVFNSDKHGFVFLAIKRHKELNDKLKLDREYKEKYDKILNNIKLKTQTK